jgi:hypothetical protein
LIHHLGYRSILTIFPNGQGGLERGCLAASPVLVGDPDKICSLAWASCYIRVVGSRSRGSVSGSFRCRAIAPLSAALRPARYRSEASAKGGTLCRELTTAETISIVIVIDDNQAIREAIGSLLRSVGLQAKLLASADEFLKTGRQAGPAFLVLDVRLSGRSGLGSLGSDCHNQTGSASAATARRRGSKSLQHSLE